MTSINDLSREIHRAYSEARRTLQKWVAREAPGKGPMWDRYDAALDRFYAAVSAMRSHAETVAREERRYREDYHKLRRELAEAVHTDRLSPLELATAWGITEEEAT